MYVCSICTAEKEFRLCKNIAKFSQNLPFSACKILHFGRKILEFFFAKNRVDSFVNDNFSNEGFDEGHLPGVGPRMCMMPR